MRALTVLPTAVLSLVAVSLRPSLAHGPAATGSGVVGLDVYAQEAIVDVLLAEKSAAGVALRHQRSRDGGATWSEPRAVPAEVKSARRGDEPQIAAVGDRLVVLWTRPGGSRFGKGPLGTALSADGGATWTPGPNPADDGREDGHAFADLAADAAGTLFVAWLDSRDGAQGLRAAVSRDAGRTWEKNASPDARSCECCWNRVTAAGKDGAYVLYRDRDPRDMALAVTRDAGREWARRGTVGSFGWQFEGCPEVGGGLVARAERLDAVVWTGETSRQGVYALASTDDGRTWTAPVPLGSKAARSPDLARAGSGLEALWEEKGAVYGARSRDDGRSWSTPEKLSGDGVRAVHPYVVATGEGRFLAVWTEREGEGPWRFQSRRLDAPEASVD